LLFSFLIKAITTFLLVVSEGNSFHYYFWYFRNRFDQNNYCNIVNISQEKGSGTKN
jgi:hypothetical protein